MDSYAIDTQACRDRQRRLLEAIEPLGVDLAILTRRESVQWSTGVYVKAHFEPVVLLSKEGHATLVLPERQIGESAAADEVLGYEAKWHSTNRDEQRAASMEVVAKKFPRLPKAIACEFEAFPPQLLECKAAVSGIDSVIFELRRRKDADELWMLERANEANRAMYERARQIAQPGANELDIYSELQAVAVRTLGEPLTYFGQDFRSGARGGAPRDRPIQAGELMIFDLGVGFRGYYSDNARTIAVGGQPTDKQQAAWKAATAIFGFIQSEARPGVSCRKLFDEAQRQLDEYRPWVFNHHLGHGVGLAPQEGPHLNPRWEDALAEGDFIAVEPGLYHEELRTGVRVEQNYLVTARGVQLLTDWPLTM